MTRDGDLEPVQAGSLSGLVRPGSGEAPSPVVLIHGYGGDERAMWIFAPGIPTGPTVAAFRGPFPAAEGGFRWHVGRRWPPPPADVLTPAVDALRGAQALLGGRGGIVWIGFSQGAAVAFQCAAAGLPTRAVVCLAGYLPESIGLLPERLPVFWAHGTEDDRVPIEAARASANLLRESGVDLEFCEAKTGHKLSAGCLRAMRGWLEKRIPSPSTA